MSKWILAINNNDESDYYESPIENDYTMFYMAQGIAYTLMENKSVKADYVDEIMSLPWYEMSDDEKQSAIDTYDDWCCFETEQMLDDCERYGTINRHGFTLKLVEIPD